MENGEGINGIIFRFLILVTRNSKSLKKKLLKIRCNLKSKHVKK